MSDGSEFHTVFGRLCNSNTLCLSWVPAHYAEGLLFRGSTISRLGLGLVGLVLGLVGLGLGLGI